MSNTAKHIRVLGICGSPRHNGNTEILIDEVLRGAEEAGAEAKKVLLSKLDIRHCTGCEICQKTGECVQQDDMSALLTQMEQSHVWIWGTPVYWHGPTGQFKTFLDRCYSRVHGLKKTRNARQAILVIPLADNAGIARHTVGMLTTSLKGITEEVLATIIAPGVWESGAVRNYPDVLAAARRAGREAVEKFN